MPFRAPFPAASPLHLPIPAGLTGNPVSRAAARLTCEGLTDDRHSAMGRHRRAGGVECSGWADLRGMVGQVANSGSPAQHVAEIKELGGAPHV